MSKRTGKQPDKTDTGNTIRGRIHRLTLILSFLVILSVFWSLKLTGITLAGEAFCGKDEHVHSEECTYGSKLCILVAHVHTAECYCDVTADLETAEQWEASITDRMLSTIPAENVAAVARTQLGYTESTLNFQVDSQGVQRGITRYGQWYGNPYGDWSAMFASFCLHYAGIEEVPFNSGPEAMRLEWDNEMLFLPAEDDVPRIGNLIFLDRNNNFQADSVAIITDYTEESITFIEGDYENTVTEHTCSISDPAVMGYGIVPGNEATDDPISVFAVGDRRTVWLDGTDGGLAHLTGSPNTAYSVREGDTIILPETWTSPSKYSYKLRGWYDIIYNRYYLPGEEMVVPGNTVLYADWVASTYDIGVFNAQVADTVSTNSFITTYMFDYNYLFNIHASKPQYSISADRHSETWSMVTTGTVPHNKDETIRFIFVDNDSGGKLCIPNNRDNYNTYAGEGKIQQGIYSNVDNLNELLFSPDNCFDPATGTGLLGKTFLGTGDHLFQIETDPSSEHYGYYYYDSERNAASYNQSNQRFYVYDYLAATSDSIGKSYSDFLPLNSPYANTNGKNIGTYNYAGVDGEYQGVPHYRYDSKYNSGDYNSTNNVQTDYAYGMKVDILFYLPNDPGTGGNKDLFGNDMQFQFSGDDDLWVLVDGTLVLDIGGIHVAEDGVIDFSTGQVTVQGKQQTTLMDLGITAGDHTLSVLYLERGSSRSTCSIYFNLSPRFGLELKKEDVLTQQLLDGTQFRIFEDFECTIPAELWDSERAYTEDLADGVLDSSKNTFTVENGVAKLWGLGSGNTYYIKETGAPAAEGYGIADGLIRLIIEKDGQATYHVDVVADADGNEPSNGFTVHGVRIDEGTQTVYLVATNAPESVVDTTTVQVIKKWEDTANHSGDYITAYLTVTDPDGTVRRIREITLSDENEWNYTWTNLPKYDYDTLVEVQYGIEESYESGYYSTVRKITQIEISRTDWAEAATFINGESYILKSNNGYLSTTSTSDAKLKWVDEATAQNSPLATWTATVSGGKVKFTNGAKQILTFNNGNSNSNRYFHATTNSTSYQSFTPVDVGTGFRFYVTRSSRNYYLSSSGINSSGRIPSTTSSSSGLILTPMKKITETDVQQVENWAYQITNTPLDKGNETSLSVKKEWVIPAGYDATLYHEYVVTVQLLANGVNTGRSITLTLKNQWSGVFQGLPYKDDNGNVIVYTVEETWEKEKWSTFYGEIITSGGTTPTYSTTITNTFHPGGPELPSTGTAARLMYVLCGSGIMAGSLVYGMISRRKRERRMK